MFPAAAGLGEFISGFCEKSQELVNRQLNLRKEKKTWEKRNAMRSQGYAGAGKREEENKCAIQ